LIEHLEAQRKLDQKWLRRLLEDVEAGRVTDVPDPTRLGDGGESSRVISNE
jgi:hypothetical protein